MEEDEDDGNYSDEHDAMQGTPVRLTRQEEVEYAKKIPADVKLAKDNGHKLYDFLLRGRGASRIRRNGVDPIDSLTLYSAANACGVYVHSGYDMQAHMRQLPYAHALIRNHVTKNLHPTNKRAQALVLRRIYSYVQRIREVQAAQLETHEKRKEAERAAAAEYYTRRLPLIAWLRLVFRELTTYWRGSKKNPIDNKRSRVMITSAAVNGRDFEFETVNGQRDTIPHANSGRVSMSEIALEDASGELIPGCINVGYALSVYIPAPIREAIDEHLAMADRYQLMAISKEYCRPSRELVSLVIFYLKCSLYVSLHKSDMDMAYLRGMKAADFVDDDDYSDAWIDVIDGSLVYPPLNNGKQFLYLDQ